MMEPPPRGPAGAASALAWLPANRRPGYRRVKILGPLQHLFLRLQRNWIAVTLPRGIFRSSFRLLCAYGYSRAHDFSLILHKTSRSRCW